VTPLPSVIPASVIQNRLQRIFPDGTPNRQYCTRDIAAKTVFVMLYAGAVDGRDTFVRPNQVARMSDAQASKTDDASRLAWAAASLGRQEIQVPGRWYADNTREPIRDETLRDGLMRMGAVVVRPDIPTTSSVPRYALAMSFAALFRPELVEEALAEAISEWQSANLSASALARVQIVRKGIVATKTGMLVSFPNGETRRLAAGPSSVITKAVLEEFAPRFLSRPGVNFLSESGNKVVARDDDLAKSIHLKIPADRYLPDILLVDLGPRDPLLIFVEVVATDGPINEARKQALLEIATDAGLKKRQVAFVSAYLDLSQPAFRKTIPELAWHSFAWFAEEPDNIVVLRDRVGDRHSKLSDLLA